jgi:hypothetical protein
MSTPRDERLKDFRGLRERALRKPENFGAFLGELHRFLHDLYEAAARADDNEDGFVKVLAELCPERGIDRWEDFVPPDQQNQFFKDGSDPAAQRIIAFWSELDEPLAL